MFLLQGPGRRRWQISHQSDLRLKEDAPLKLLREFRPEQEWTLDPGDMLYLPPGWAHDGVAIDACMTYSIGFRAPAWQDLAVEFLRHLEDEIFADGMYEDPHLIPTRQPGRMAPDMIREATNRLERLRWRPSAVPRFLGRHLTEPKTHVVFAQPQPALSRSAFAQAAQRRGVQLDLKTQMLYTGALFFINGESAQVTGRARDTLKELADRRCLRAGGFEPARARHVAARMVSCRISAAGGQPMTTEPQSQQSNIDGNHEYEAALDTLFAPVRTHAADFRSGAERRL